MTLAEAIDHAEFQLLRISDLEAEAAARKVGLPHMCLTAQPEAWARVLHTAALLVVLGNIHSRRSQMPIDTRCKTTTAVKIHTKDAKRQWGCAGSGQGGCRRAAGGELGSGDAQGAADGGPAPH